MKVKNFITFCSLSLTVHCQISFDMCLCLYCAALTIYVFHFSRAHQINSYHFAETLCMTEITGKVSRLDF